MRSATKDSFYSILQNVDILVILGFIRNLKLYCKVFDEESR